MKILQINSVCGIGSTGRIATDIHQMLKKQGHESYIAYGRGEPRNCDNAIRIGYRIDVYSHVALTRVFDRHGFGSKKATEDFIQKVKEIDPDIIHLHNIHGYYINIEVLFEYLKTSNKPVIWTLHDCWAFTGHCVHFDYIGCDRWKTGCFNCPQKLEYPKSIFFDNSYVNYQKKREMFTSLSNLSIVSPSKWLSKQISQSFLKKNRVIVLNNGVDLNVFRPTNSSFRDKYNITDKFIILGVSNFWTKKKGLDYFIQLSKVLEKEEVIVLVGVSESQLSSLPMNIIAIQKTDNQIELAKIYTSADVFVNPTLEEVFGMTNIESLACGTPVISFDTGGCSECFTKETGIVLNDKTTEAIRFGISSLKNGEKSILSYHCEKRVQEFFNINDKYIDYINLYKALGLSQI